MGEWEGGRWEAGWEWKGGRLEVGGMKGAGGGGRREGFGSVWCGPKYFGSVRYGSRRFDTILGESIVETTAAWLWALGAEQSASAC